MPFDAEAETAQINNLDPFFTAFDANANRLVKDEFESTEEHTARMRSPEAYGIFNKDAVYALEVARTGSFRYDADAQTYRPVFGYDHECSTLYWYAMDNQVACELGSVIDSRRPFEGENAFGRKADAVDLRGRYFSVLVNRKSKGLIPRRIASDIISYTRKGDCPIPRAEAQEWKHRLAFAYLIKIRDAQIRAGELEYEQATISKPEGRHFERLGIPSELIGFICYDNDTKVILHKIMF